MEYGSFDPTEVEDNTVDEGVPPEAETDSDPDLLDEIAHDEGVVNQDTVVTTEPAGEANLEDNEAPSPSRAKAWYGSNGEEIKLHDVVQDSEGNVGEVTGRWTKRPQGSFVPYLTVKYEDGRQHIAASSVCKVVHVTDEAVGESL